MSLCAPAFHTAFSNRGNDGEEQEAKTAPRKRERGELVRRPLMNVVTFDDDDT